jgi:plasmid stabilization system protein ParE
MDVIWSREAKADFYEGVLWLDARNPEAADRFEHDVQKSVAILSLHPGLGRPTTTVGVRIFSLPKWHRRIAYQDLGNFILITNLRDTRQEPRD